MQTLLLSIFSPHRVKHAGLVIFLAFVATLGIAGPSVPGSTAHAQGRDIIFIRDTEIENTIRYYLQPIYDAAGVDASTVKIHLIRDDRLNAFVACAHPGENHAPAFLVCRICDAVAEAQSEPERGRLGAAAKDAGFKIERAVVEAVGICPNCQDAA